MNCSVLALNAVFCSGLLGALRIYVHYSDTLYNNESSSKDSARKNNIHVVSRAAEPGAGVPELDIFPGVRVQIKKNRRNRS